ncbi:MAG TPA: peptide deformylase [Anaerolineae bacterium]|nr:peptide deformylase [Anaerolineae bacterium]
MAIRHILTVENDNPKLRQKSKKVKKVTPAIQALMDDMVETMRAAPGMGLAAIQVGVPLRVIVAELPEDEEDPQSGRLYALVNPEIVRASDEVEEMEEGCLSVPGYIGFIKRPVAVTVKGLNRRGRPVRIKARGLLARVLQHEMDHLEGILFPDRLESPDKLFRLRPKEEGAEEMVLEPVIA